MKGPKFVVVEDSADDREFIKSAIHNVYPNAIVQEFEDGCELITHIHFSSTNFHNFSPSVIILDLYTPKISGMEVLKYFHSYSIASTALKVIFSTSDNE